MNILIPMAGEGRRFKDAGYDISKPAILTYDRKTGNKKPMVVCATLDLPGINEDGSNIIYVDRNFHKIDGTEENISKCFPRARFIHVNYLTEGQACTCLLAGSYINNEKELIIAGCDNGMEFNEKKFVKLCNEADMLVFTYRNNEAVLSNPNSYGWMIVDEQENVIGTSIKRAISDNPIKDHAVVATFWFKHGRIFVEGVNKMITENDRVNNEFYVDQVAKHVLDLGYKVKIFEVDRYIGWGTPSDYETYQKTFEYWLGFARKEREKIK